MYAIYGNMDPINIPQMLAYIYHTWILWVTPPNINSFQIIGDSSDSEEREAMLGPGFLLWVRVSVRAVDSALAPFGHGKTR
jgi:hypothetical protein